MFQAVLVIHIVAAAGIFTAMAIEWRRMTNLGRAGGMRRLGSRSTPSASRLESVRGQGWPWAAVAGLVFMRALGTVSGIGREGFVETLWARDGARSVGWNTAITRRFRPPLLARIAMAFGVLCLMLAKPGPRASLVTLAGLAPVGAVSLVTTHPHRTR